MQELYLLTAVLSVCAYFICGIPFGLIVGMITDNVDVRTLGSGNIGMTNVARNLGAGPAALTFLLDMLKGTLSVLAARFVLCQVAFEGNWQATSTSSALSWTVCCVFLACVLGHVFSPYLHFKGGKGIAVGFGAALGLNWVFALALLAVFFLFAVPSRYISLGSCMVAVALTPFAYLFGLNGSSIIICAMCASVVLYSHRENVVRLIQGKERRFSISHKDKHGK